MPNFHQLFNRPPNKSRRQALRANLTEPEKRLWQALRGKQLGFKFRRQHGIGPYIVDFYSPEAALVIELDGDSHFDAKALAYDRARDLFMTSKGIQVLRFTNQDVLKQHASVLDIIHTVLKTREL